MNQLAARVNVILVDDHELFREGLRALLATDDRLVVIGQAATSQQACALVDQLKPAVVILDLSLPDMNGIATTREILRLQPDTRVLILTMHTAPFFVRRALGAGAAGYVLKSSSSEDILAAVYAVARGETYVVPSMIVLQPGDGDEGPQVDSLDARAQLSHREREIFELIVGGLSNHAIADQLSISVKTVETHRSHINKKLDVHSTGELIRLSAVQDAVLRGDWRTAGSVPVS